VLKEALKILRAGNKGRSIYDRLVSHRAAMALLALTRRFLAFLDREKRQLGVVDFDDLLLRTLALLDDERVLARARAQFDYIFVEAQAIAEWIRANSEGDLRRFALLFRRLTKLDDYLDTLDRYGIDYVLPPTRMFLDRRAPVDLLAVLRAIAHPFDKGAQISAARTPYFALTDEEIAGGMLGAEHRVLGNDTQHPAPSTQHPWQTFKATIEQYRQAARHLTVSQLIDLIIETSNIEAIYDAAADGARHLRHLEHLRAIAFEYD